MRYIATSSPRVEWLRQALRQILFVFIPVTSLGIYTYLFHITDYQYMQQIDMSVISILVGIPAGVALWMVYRIVRFAIGR